MQVVIPILENKAFVDNNQGKNFNVIYQFDNTSGEDINEFIKKLNEEIEQIKYFDLSSSVDVYNNTTTFVVVHGLKSIEGAKGFGELLKERKSKICLLYTSPSPRDS